MTNFRCPKAFAHRKAILLVAVALVGSVAVPATATALGPELGPVVTLRVGGQQPDVSANDEGDAVAVWQGQEGRVQAATERVGDGWSSVTTLSPSIGGAEFPQVVTDSSGDSFAIWQRHPAGSSSFVIEASVKSLLGEWQAPTVIAADASGSKGPDIAVDPGGNAVAVWQDVGQEIEAAYRPAGQSWGSPVAISSSGQPASEPRVAADGTGHVVAVWVEQGRIRSAAKLATGTWEAPVSLSAPAKGQSSREPAIAVDPAGEAVAAWIEVLGESAESFNLVEVARRPPGGTWKAPFRLSPEEGRSFHPQVSIEGSIIGIIWVRRDGRVVVGRSPNLGLTQTVLLSPSRVVASDPQIAVDPAGRAVAIWSVPGGPIEVSEAPTRDDWMKVPVQLVPSGAGAAPQIASAGAGAVAIWVKDEGGTSVIQAADQGVALPPPPPQILTATEPPTPADDNTPLVLGSAATGSTVEIFANSTCFGSPVATASAEELESPGVPIHVRDNTTTQLYATATIGGSTSSCEGPLAYSERSSPIGLSEALAGLPALDQFKLPEGPLSGLGSWAQMPVDDPGFVSSYGWGSHGPSTLESGAFWTHSELVDTGTGDAVAARLMAAPGVKNRHFSVWLDMPNPGEQRSGYELRFTEMNPGSYDASLLRWNGGSVTALATTSAVSLPLGSYFALVDRGNGVSAWTDPGSGYTQLMAAADPTFAQGYAGVSAVGAGARLRRFEAAALPVASP
jgi:hypothetical protein